MLGSFLLFATQKSDTSEGRVINFSFTNFLFSLCNFYGSSFIRGIIQTSRSYNHYDSHEEDEDWRIHQYDERRHQHHPSKISFPYVKLPSFSGEIDPNIYLGWEAKVEQIFNVYEVQEDKKVKLTSLEFLDYAMQWWHQVVMDKQEANCGLLV